ncbi:molybdopterin cofactor-binding domain-containing protein, partial [Vibrio cholerae]
KVYEAEYVFPYLAHASMEPLNCVMKFENGQCEVWNGEQLHTADQFAIAKAFGIEPDRVTVNMVYAGGSFGRRANPQSDYLLETAQIVKA